MGRTPGKSSSTGRKVIARMRAEGKVRGYGKNTEFLSGEKWYPIKEADMAHKTDAVKWWNRTGRFFGARSERVRKWMRNANNYYLEHFSKNRSQGAKLKDEYLPPAKK